MDSLPPERLWRRTPGRQTIFFRDEPVLLVSTVTSIGIASYLSQVEMCVESEIICAWNLRSSVESEISRILTVESSLATSTKNLTVKSSLAKRRGCEIQIICVIHVSRFTDSNP